MTSGKTYFRPSGIDEALSLYAQFRPDSRYVAGGTDVLVNKYQGNDITGCIIDITGINSLKTVEISGSFLRIGALVSLDELVSNREIRSRFPALAEAAGEVASPVLRKTATIGGNILCENRCSFYNQSDWWRESVGYCLKCEGNVCIATGGKKACFSRFVSDTAPVLISLGAVLEVASACGKTQIPLEKIYTGDGIHPRNLPDASLVTHIILPLQPAYQVIFRKLRPRNAVDFTSLTTATSLDEGGRLRFVIGGVDPAPVVVTGDIHGSIEDYIKTGLRKSRVVDNDFYSREYRRDMIRLFMTQSHAELMRNFNTGL